MYPCDEVCIAVLGCAVSCVGLTACSPQEEKERMDIYHTMFLVARHQVLHDAPLAQPINAETRVMDVGCGTGIWAIDMAESVLPANV